MKQKLAWMAWALLAFAAPACAITWHDPFEGGTLDAGRWSATTVGGASFAVTGGRLVVDIPQTLTAPDASASFQTLLPAVGDCDYQVDYRLETWPASSGVRVGLFAHFQYGPIVVHRYNYAAGHPEMYSVSFGSWWNGYVTNDTEGTLRFRRQGSFVAGYAKIPGGWQEIGSWGLAGGEDLGVSLGVWTHSNLFGGQRTRVSFDNFQFTDSSVPEPTGLVALGLGAFALLFRGRGSRRR